jgi:DNA-binding XRE family transcriptional regulator
MLEQSSELQQIYAEIVVLDDAEINEPIMLAGMMTELKHIERERIGQRIRELREKQGLTQEQLAKRTDLLKQNISRIEQGRYSTGQDILSRIAWALGCDLDFI